MTTFRLILKEVLHRKFNVLLSLLAVVTAVAVFVGFFTTGEASKRETVRLMRDIGFNLRIVPRETDMERFWVEGVSEHLMPEAYVNRFASAEGISYNHLLASLQKKVSWRGRDIILTGLASKEVHPKGKKKTRMPTSFRIKPGTVYVGYEIAKALELKKGDAVELLGEPMTVAACLSEAGSVDDIRITVHLSDAQRLLGAEGKINEIKALECLCDERHLDVRAALREQIERILPGAKVIQMSSIASARQRQRWMAEDYFAFIMPVLVVVCAAWIGALAMINVRDRQQEIGVLRALGHGSGRIALLFLGKAVLVGLVGAALGYLVGTALALRFGPGIFVVTAAKVQAMPRLLVWSLIAAPVFAALSSFIPAVVAVTQDPARTLSEE